LVKLRAAKTSLEDEARERAGAQAQKRAKDAGHDEDTVMQRGAAAAARAVPRPRAQRNFTDPQSRIMKTASGAFEQCFNAQAVVDADHQVIVATDLNACASDSPELVPMFEAVIANTGRAPGQVLADAGYCTKDNLTDTAQLTAEHGTEFLLATGRLGHDEHVPAAPRGPIPKDATLKERMARKLRTKAGRAAYARRKAIVEPVFGQISVLQGKNVLLRGQDQAHGEWLLLAACHNLRKLHGHIGITGLKVLQAPA
jgi:hypothetical protein